jgi:hypothetical protein
VRRVTLSGFALMLLVVVLTPWWQGCGLDPPKKPQPPIELPVFPPESPEDVLKNMVYSYNYFDPERYSALLDDEFQFFIWSGDQGSIPGDLAPEGYWVRGIEVDIADNMMDPNFIPTDYESGNPAPELQIDRMQMELTFSGDMDTTNLEGAPDGTLQSYVNFDLQVTTRGTVIYVVHSRPLFYFTPNEEGEKVTWTIWRVDDGENLNNPN